MRDAELLGGLALLVLGGLVVAGSLTMPLGSIVAPGSGFLPLVVGAGIVAASVLALARRRAIREDPHWPAGAGRRRLATFVGLVAGYAIATPVAGFSTATFVFSLVSIRWLTPYRHRDVLLIAFGSTAIMHLVFHSLLSLPLPSGRIGLF